MPDSHWIFGYGSLVWRPAFPFRARRAAFVEGWSRRFWQGSTDHRGRPGAPGRVVTLVEEAGARCWGMAYEVDPEHWSEVVERLDHREKGGYQRVRAPLGFVDTPSERGPQALIYVATAQNVNYLGPAPLEEIAAQVRAARGPSGPNDEYVLRLAEALREMDAEDPHVFDLEALLAR